MFFSYEMNTRLSWIILLYQYIVAYTAYLIFGFDPTLVTTLILIVGIVSSYYLAKKTIYWFSIFNVVESRRLAPSEDIFLNLRGDKGSLGPFFYYPMLVYIPVYLIASIEQYFEFSGLVFIIALLLMSYAWYKAQFAWINVQVEKIPLQLRKETEAEKLKREEQERIEEAERERRYQRRKMFEGNPNCHHEFEEYSMGLTKKRRCKKCSRLEFLHRGRWELND